jgi:hypothetical protein
MDVRPKSTSRGLDLAQPGVGDRQRAAALAFSATPSRLAWVSPEARALHEPSLQALADRWRQTEWMSADKVRPCALVSAPVEALPAWDEALEPEGVRRLNIRLTERQARGAGLEPSVVATFAIGSRANLRAFAKAWKSSDHDRIGALLGYPACCRRFFQQEVVSAGHGDPVWAAASATKGARIDAGQIRVDSVSLNNILLQRLGVRMIGHYPCAFDCAASQAVARELERFAGTLPSECDPIDPIAVLDWPIRWSARNGIAEIHTPVMKLVTYADPTPERRDLLWMGTTRPLQAARGLTFPYD